MTGEELETFCTGVNNGSPIESTLLFQFLNLAKAMVEERKPWMLLRKTDTSKSVTTGNTWQTAISLVSLTDFAHFIDSENTTPIKLFDGGNRIEYYRQVPWDQRLEHKDVPNTFVFDESTSTLYLNGLINFAGTLYINYVSRSSDITDDGSSTWIFPSYAHPLLGFLAVGMYKGGVDYDDINARMAPDNRAAAAVIVNLLESWDNKKQLAAIDNTDPYHSADGGYRSGAINMNP
jgi:hypothetical protein